jgi:hypothetical protein|tara:strand:+ start:343 stop:1206 length:864 start_codon:yes stop_codon:yes gene_type:complete
MKIKHSKYKNTGILFELLVRQITADTLRGNESPAIDILKKYFVKTGLGREYKLYESILKSKVVSESRATLFINTTLDNSKKFNRGSLRKQKYNLINEIKNHYDLDTFFSAKIKNYKELAALYTLIEGINSVDSTDTNQLVNNKITLLEYLTKQEVSTEQKDIVLEEFSTYDKDTRILTYKILLERFNDKYENLTSEQKQVLKEFIESVESTPGLRNFYNSKINELKNTLAENSKNIKDKVTKIKINEISKFLVELDKTDKVGDDNLVDLLQYYELVKEIKLANAVQV